jgi:hypothetical protein
MSASWRTSSECSSCRPLRSQRPQGLLGEEGAIHQARGKPARSETCYRRALELYAAISLAGARLKAADWDRIATLEPKIEAGSIDACYREEVRRLVGLASASQSEGAGIVGT